MMWPRLLMTFALVLSAPMTADAQRVATGRVLVAPFETSRDPRASWLGEGVAVLLADGLNALGGPDYWPGVGDRAFRANFDDLRGGGTGEQEREDAKAPQPRPPMPPEPHRTSPPPRCRC